MFEKSLYDLIRGLRNHKGNEKEYIQNSLVECRKEIKSTDFDLKAIALLKLTYLEMFGHDMSWAAFNVLEVMASQKYPQKRVGYLAAVQSFRQNTDVLLLAENLLKKDLTSPFPTTVALPLMAAPHVVNANMANSLLSDTLARLTHSQPGIRKKTIVTLYRLALVYPDVLRPAWPKITERLQDDDEDPSVTSAIVNVVCELGWRRPRDFLPLAPRLFRLLTEGKNNWMAIKLIKLFATLIPLEPKLIKKLLPPLTNIIKTTPAMSLLYECINGIIQSGILESMEGTREGDEVAKLCVGKLRGMLVVEGDPNLKYVALLALEKIVKSHVDLVLLHQDVILECIDDADISIRTRTLELVQYMVNSENLTSLVGRLLRQLKNSPAASGVDVTLNAAVPPNEVEPLGESDDEDMEESLRDSEIRSEKPPPLPEPYRISVIRRILDMCSRETYANVTDFEWYIDVLVQLVRFCPPDKSIGLTGDSSEHVEDLEEEEVSKAIGHELQNVAVRVRGVRPDATRAAESLIMVDQKAKMFPSAGNAGQGVLAPAAWIVGEYAELLIDPEAAMTSLIQSLGEQHRPEILATFLHAILKIFVRLTGDQQISWTRHRKSQVTLLMARIVHTLEPFTTHPDLEVQERAVEYTELMKLTSESASGQEAGDEHGSFVDPPLLLTQAIPSLFIGMELNPVAAGAQHRIPVPDDLDLDTPLKDSLQTLLQQADSSPGFAAEDDEFSAFYNEPISSSRTALSYSEPAANRLDVTPSETSSYQQAHEDEYLDPDILARRRAERRERRKDDPFYIPSDGGSGTATPLNSIIRNTNGEELDVDSIPIMDLDLGNTSSAGARTPARGVSPHRNGSGRLHVPPKKNFDIIADETPDFSTSPEPPTLLSSRKGQGKAKKGLLQVDSSGLGSLSLSDEGYGIHSTPLEIEQRKAEEAELKRIEAMRLEIQRSQVRIHAKDGDEGTLVRKKKKKKKVEAAEVEGEGAESTIVKKKKKKLKPEDGQDEVPKLKERRKKRREAVMEEDEAM